MVLGLCLVALTANGMRDVLHRQGQVFVAFQIIFLSGVALLVWFLFFSRLSQRFRRNGIGALIILSCACVLLFRIQGVSGDFIPVVSWRASSSADLTLSAVEVGDKTVAVSSAYPQFLGPDRNATLHDVHLDPDWNGRPPRQVWRREVGEGWSAFAVASGRAVTQEQRGPLEMVVCYDLLSGDVLWAHADSVRYETALGGIGPRATPTIAGDRVVTLGATGILNVLDFESGSARWSRDIVADNSARRPPWGVGGSPLVIDSLVVVSAGGPEGRSLVAYHLDRGDRVWAGGYDAAGYSSPTLTRLAGLPQILVFAELAVLSHSVSDGHVLWRNPWPPGAQCVAQPVPLPDDLVFASSGYGIGS